MLQRIAVPAASLNATFTARPIILIIEGIHPGCGAVESHVVISASPEAADRIRESHAIKATFVNFRHAEASILYLEDVSRLSWAPVSTMCQPSPTVR